VPEVLVVDVCGCCGVIEALTVDAGEAVAVVIAPGQGWGHQQHGQHAGDAASDAWRCLHISALLDLLQVTQ
jgi:hypothetical protein